MAWIEKRGCSIDWSSIAQDYVAGTLSLRQMAQKHGCSHSTIANFATRHGWTRTRPRGDAARHEAPAQEGGAPMGALLESRGGVRRLFSRDVGDQIFVAESQAPDGN